MRQLQTPFCLLIVFQLLTAKCLILFIRAHLLSCVALSSVRCAGRTTAALVIQWEACVFEEPATANLAGMGATVAKT